MKIAILGTKGIPNNYGGYEQFAEYISVKLVNRGHEVTVYNPSFHPFMKTKFNGVAIIRKFSPEHLLGGAANFIYDFLCLKDALSRDFDIIYEAGYHSVALSYLALRVRGRKRPVILTNMDGLEYQRSKWSKATRRLIKWLEKIAVKESPHLVADNLGIQEYYKTNFGREPFFIPYGADLVDGFNQNLLSRYGVAKFEYCMLVARLESENNIEAILDGHRASLLKMTFIVVGNHQTPYGTYLKKRYADSTIHFVGGVYDKNELDALRHYSLAYFHGHSVGGTNPSLLEAMACGAFIVAHDNAFNRSVLMSSAHYFRDAGDIRNILERIIELRESDQAVFAAKNRDCIRSHYSWEAIVLQHEDLFKRLLTEG